MSYQTTIAAGELLISMQKSLSPLDEDAVHFVLVVCSEAGTAEESAMSTFTLVEPALSGNVMASKVKLPVPRGKLQVFAALASPLQLTSLPMAPVISRSNVAPATSSPRFPVPVIVVFWPRVRVLGVKDAIFTLVLASPQSDQLNFKSVAEAAATKAPAVNAFIVLRGAFQESNTIRV